MALTNGFSMQAGDPDPTQQKATYIESLAQSLQEVVEYNAQNGTPFSFVESQNCDGSFDQETNDNIVCVDVDGTMKKEKCNLWKLSTTMVDQLPNINTLTPNDKWDIAFSAYNMTAAQVLAVNGVSRDIAPLDP